MTRGIAFALLGALTFASGCASQARVVNFNPADGTGSVAVPDGSDMFPTYNKQKAMALIKEKLGSDFIIVSEGEIVTGKTTQTTQETDTQQTQNRTNPNQTGDKQTFMGSVTQKNVTEYRYNFMRGPAPIGSALTSTGVTSGVTTAGMPVTVGAGQLPPGVVPSVLPVSGTQPVNGAPPRFGN